jgi:hypothetical protein
MTMKALYAFLLLASTAGAALFLLKLAVVAAIRACSSRRPRWCARSAAVAAVVCCAILAAAIASFKAEQRRRERLTERVRALYELELEAPDKSDVERMLGRPSRIVRGAVEPLLQDRFGKVAETWVYDCSVLLSPDPFSNDYFVSFDSSGRFLGGCDDVD